MRLVLEWMQSDTEVTRKMLKERREDLLGTAVEEAMQSLLADDPENAQLIFYKALLNLARTGQQDLAFDAMGDPARASATLLALARVGDVEALDALATLIFLAGETDTARATARFYEAVAMALRKQADEALGTVAEARRLDTTQVHAWLAVLVELAPKHQEVIPLSQALAAPLSASGGP